MVTLSNVLLLGSLFTLARAGNLHTFNNQRLTFYYEKTPSNICAANGGSPGNAGLPACATTEKETYAALDTNRIVAINGDLVSGTNKALCGKRVIIKDSTGKELSIPEGPFFVYDGCNACKSGTITDLSVEAFVAASGGTCGLDPPKYNNPEGYTVIITDEQVFGSSSGAESTPTNPAIQAPPAASPKAPAAPMVAVAPAAAPSDKCPEKGARACMNASIHICNAVGAPYPYLDWVNVGGSCSSKRSKPRIEECDD